MHGEKRRLAAEILDGASDAALDTEALVGLLDLSPEAGAVAQPPATDERTPPDPAFGALSAVSLLDARA